MGRRRGRETVPGIGLLIIIAVATIWTKLSEYWNGLISESRVILGILLGVALVSAIGFLVYWNAYRKRRRRLAWQRAMCNWGHSRREGQAPAYESARYFTAQELERFAGQLFKQMGYEVTHTGKSGDHGIDVRLINPNDEVELVQCKQWHKPVGEPEVRNLAGAMVHENAVRGFILAPAGFSQSAKRWAKDKHIVLADEAEIGKMVESVYRIR